MAENSFILPSNQPLIGTCLTDKMPSIHYYYTQTQVDSYNSYYGDSYYGDYLYKVYIICPSCIYLFNQFHTDSCGC